MDFLDVKISAAIEVMESAHERQAVLESLLSMPVHHCGCLASKYPRVHAEKHLEARLAYLRHCISDAALQQVTSLS